ncbi:glycerol-3-phosphate 1-O-acyltransferase PlsY [Segnochrobactraceae bacterium EtOH-i3]
MLDQFLVLDQVAWSPLWPNLAVAAAFGYLCGSIPFGLILTKAAGLGDIRAIGSGNIGATNVLRTGNRKIAAATLLCDALKGTAAVLLARLYGFDLGFVAAIGAFLGHTFPVWLGFRGGKGVATYIGVLLGLWWPAAIGFCAFWLVTAKVTKYSSLSALLAALATPIVLIGLGRTLLGLVMAVLSVILWARHHENISRLLKGTESRIGQKK